MQCGVTVVGELCRIPLGALHMSCTSSTDTTPLFLILQKPLGPPAQSSQSPLFVVELRAIKDPILIQPAMCAGFGCTSNHVLRIAWRTSEPIAGEYRRLSPSPGLPVAEIRTRRPAEQPRRGA